MELENACTKVQVFHSWYREKEAKTGAKVKNSGNIFVLCLL